MFNWIFRVLMISVIGAMLIVALVSCVPSKPIPVEPPPAPVDTTPPPPVEGEFDPGPDAEELEALSILAKLHNQERSKAGAGALVLNPKLMAAASLHARWMANNKKMTHEGIHGSMPWTRVQAANYAYISVGENIAYGYRSPASVMTGWMNSTGHRANILNRNFKELGIAVATDSKGVPYWCAVFARPKTAGASTLEEPNTYYPPAIYADIEEINDLRGFNNK